MYERLHSIGIVVTVKQRQEFRIRLQKRARRAAERKLETFMEDQHAKTVSQTV
jgi:hypothetical protein